MQNFTPIGRNITEIAVPVQKEQHTKKQHIHTLTLNLVSVTKRIPVLQLPDN